MKTETPPGDYSGRGFEERTMDYTRTRGPQSHRNYVRNTSNPEKGYLMSTTTPTPERLKL